MANISLDDPAAARAWFTGTVEPLADSFEPANVDRYVHLFAEAIERVNPSLQVGEVIGRFQRIRQPRRFAGPDPGDVFVLSRVTLGADIAITSVMLDAAMRRFPRARIWFAGSAKAHEMFAANPRIGHAPAAYHRSGSVRERIAASQSLCKLLDLPNGIVIDPDSRLTQLGLVPVCPESRYYFFESRGSHEPGTLTDLAVDWVKCTFGIDDAKPFMSLPGPPVQAGITVSLGVGENPAKRVRDPFERLLLEALSERGTVLVDQGAGGEESERVTKAAAGLPNVRLFLGSFSKFAAAIAGSRLYVGYDSAGQHAASALGIPLVAVFAGYPNERFLERWSPSSGTIIRARGTPEEIVGQALSLRRAPSPPPD